VRLASLGEKASSGVWGNWGVAYIYVAYGGKDRCKRLSRADFHLLGTLEVERFED
jgi:hypothetical protein